MKKTGAWLARYALEQVGVKYTFGIPGVHNTELYDELNKSDQIQPVLVSHEMGASFSADAISRVGGSIGTIVVVPAAGLTHAASGIGEAFLDGIPMLVISGGVRIDLDKTYQLHEMDQHQLMASITKASFLPNTHDDIIPMIYEAYRTATEGEPGPVYVELPVNIQLTAGKVSKIQDFIPTEKSSWSNEADIKKVIDLIGQSRKPAFFVGWGARAARKELEILAEHFNAPVSTTLQGLGVFPADHPLHTGMSFGRSSVPAAENAFSDCDCLIAVGTRFSEIPTGSFGVVVPDNLVHIDINPEVFNKNYPAKITLEGDAKLILEQLASAAQSKNPNPDNGLPKKIQADKEAYREQWRNHQSKGKVNPALFFDQLHAQLDHDAIIVADDGNHTFLCAELMPITGNRKFISPSDFNAMGYAVPAANASKLSNPDKTVVSIIGDGAMLMTGMESVTAATLSLGVVYFIFNDGELSQISQAQEIPYNRKTCTVLNRIKWEGMALATGCEYIMINSSESIESGIRQALEFANRHIPVIVDVKIDYSKRTRFTEGTVKTNLQRFDLATKARLIGRAVSRKITG